MQIVIIIAIIFLIIFIFSWWPWGNKDQKANWSLLRGRHSFEERQIQFGEPLAYICKRMYNAVVCMYNHVYAGVCIRRRVYMQAPVCIWRYTQAYVWADVWLRSRIFVFGCIGKRYAGVCIHRRMYMQARVWICMYMQAYVYVDVCAALERILKPALTLSAIVTGYPRWIPCYRCLRWI